MTSTSTTKLPEPPGPPQYYTTREVAVILRTSEDVVRGLCASGQLRAFRLGHRWRIHADSVSHLVG